MRILHLIALLFLYLPSFSFGAKTEIAPYKIRLLRLQLMLEDLNKPDNIVIKMCHAQLPAMRRTICDHMNQINIKKDGYDDKEPDAFIKAYYDLKDSVENTYKYKVNILQAISKAVDHNKIYILDWADKYAQAQEYLRYMQQSKKIDLSNLNAIDSFCAAINNEFDALDLLLNEDFVAQ